MGVLPLLPGSARSTPPCRRSSPSSLHPSLLPSSGHPQCVLPGFMLQLPAYCCSGQRAFSLNSPVFICAPAQDSGSLLCGPAGVGLDGSAVMTAQCSEAFLSTPPTPHSFFSGFTTALHIPLGQKVPDWLSRSDWDPLVPTWGLGGPWEVDLLVSLSPSKKPFLVKLSSLAFSSGSFSLWGHSA